MTDQIASRLQRLHFAGFPPLDAAWQPAVNVYVFADRLEICMELAGVNRQDIELEVTSRRLVIQGCRTLPGGAHECPPCKRILMMEIADGRFERVLEFPLDIEPGRVEARQENGWLWITLPTAQQEI